MARKQSDEEDPCPAIVERRYNDFLNLYNGLKRDFPNHLSAIQFPRKLIIGNFNHDMILIRSAGFEALLALIGSESQFRQSSIVMSFFQDKELIEAIKLIREHQYQQARPLVENSFRLMNKIETDRAPSVLRLLCLLVCVSWLSADSMTASLASLAIRRYQAVSDIDLLRYYVPLLHIARDICDDARIETDIIIEQLARLKASGIPIDCKRNLLAMLVDDLSECLSI